LPWLLLVGLVRHRSIRRRVGQRRLVDAKSQPMVAAKAKDKGLVDHDLAALIVRQVHVTHGDGDISVNLDAVFCRVVLVPHPRPRLQSKSLVIGEVGISSHEI